MIKYDDLPPRIGTGEAEAIIDKIKKGECTPEDRKKLVDGYLRMAWAIAFKVSRTSGLYHFFDEKRNDALNGAVVGLCEAVDRMINKKVEIDNEYYKYLNRWMSRRCQDALRSVRVTVVPFRTIRHKVKTGMNSKKQVVEEIKGLSEEAKNVIALLPPMYQNEMRELAEKVDLYELKKNVRTKLFELLRKRNEATVGSDYSQISADITDTREVFVPEAKLEEIGIELKEILNSATYTLREQDVINYRMQGMSYDEIGKLYSMTPVAVFHVVERVRVRFDEIWDRKL